MADEKDREEDKFEFDSAGEAFVYISIDQAEVLAIQHARDNRRFYGGRFGGQELVWEVAKSEESDEYYHVTLSVRPAGRYRGRPGTEQITIDKTGTVQVRQVLEVPAQRRSPALLVGTIALLAIALVAGGVVFATRAEGDEGTPPAAVPPVQPGSSPSRSPQA